MKKTMINPLSWDDLKVFKNGYFLHLFFTLSITYLYPHFGLFSFKNIGLDKLSDSWITTAGIFGSLMNASIRVIIGMGFKKWGYAPCAIFITFVQITSCIILVPSVNNKWAYLGSLVWFFITFGG